MAVVGLPVWTPGVWADTVWSAGVWAAEAGGEYTADTTNRRKIPMQIVIDGRGRLIAQDYEAVTVDGTARSLNTTKVAAAWGAKILLETGPIRYLHHGALVPTASIGIPLANSQEITVLGQDMRNLKMIKSGADNGIAHVTYLQNDKEPMG
jgi:hypothetical protein